mmetsp:Transcript_709/g.1042  ORF Transcript_709/g.1042 Transcript_709/m.1042 type:complete len:218 (+) Transcript_709:1204-1857(+)
MVPCPFLRRFMTVCAFTASHSFAIKGSRNLEFIPSLLSTLSRIPITSLALPPSILELENTALSTLIASSTHSPMFGNSLHFKMYVFSNLIAATFGANPDSLSLKTSTTNDIKFICIGVDFILVRVESRLTKDRNELESIESSSRCQPLMNIISTVFHRASFSPCSRLSSLQRWLLITFMKCDANLAALSLRLSRERLQMHEQSEKNPKSVNVMIFSN